jgi:hypothetical protein
MKSLGPAVDHGIPHEAGHILVGRMVGIPTRGVDVEVVRLRDPEGIRVGDFATLGYAPPDDEIPAMNPELRAAFMLYIAGGVAGNKFSGMTKIGSEADSDRMALARITNKSLEEISDVAVGIINKRRREFRQLVSLIRQRYVDRITKNRNIESGRHLLVTQADLDKLFGECISSNSQNGGVAQ